MKKLILVFIGVVFLSSCKEDLKQTLHKSVWIDKESEMIEITILKENNSYRLKGYRGTDKIKKNEKGHFVTINYKGDSILINKGSLFLSGTEFIPKSKSLKNKFFGVWENKETNTTLTFKKINGGLICDVREKNLGDRYYPKTNLEGFYFTYKNIDRLFTIKKNVMIDSNGNTYNKI